MSSPRTKTDPADGGATGRQFTWKGVISFGLVENPVGLRSAESRSELKLSLLDRRDFAPVGYEPRMFEEVSSPVGRRSRMEQRINPNQDDVKDDPRKIPDPPSQPPGQPELPPQSPPLEPDQPPSMTSE